MKEGRELLIQGHPEGALRKYRQAYALEPKPNVLLAMAIVEHELKRPAEALGHLRHYLRDPNAKNGAELRSTLQRELEQLTGHVRVKKPAGTELRLDGALIGEALVDGVIDVLPGKHSFEAASESRVVDIDAGHSADVDLTPAAPVRRADDATTYPPSEERSSSSARWIVSGSLFAGSLVGLGLGVGFGLAARSSAREGENLRTSSRGVCGTPGTLCDKYSDKFSDADSQTKTSIGGYIVGGALLVGAVVTFLVWPRDSRTSSSRGRVTPALGTGFAGAAFETSF